MKSQWRSWVQSWHWTERIKVLHIVCFPELISASQLQQQSESAARQSSFPHSGRQVLLLASCPKASSLPGKSCNVADRKPQGMEIKKLGYGVSHIRDTKWPPLSQGMSFQNMCQCTHYLSRLARPSHSLKESTQYSQVQ